MNRNRSIAGLVIPAVLMILVGFGSILLFREWNKGQAQTGHREPLPGLSYCSSNQIRPCVLFFSLDADGNMLINILTDRRGANIYVKVKQGERKWTYKCQTVAGFFTTLACTGEKMPVGEMFSFTILSAKDNVPLAEGTFPIIGLAIATPEIFVTPTFIPAFDRPPR